MLIPVIFILAVLVTLGTALLDASRDAMRSASQAAIARTADVALASGVARYTHGLATYIAAYGPAHAPQLPSRSAPQAICAPADPPGACTLTATITATVTGASGDAHAGSDAIPSAQTSALAEGRLSAVVTATIVAANGAELGARSRLITYRVFAAPPYAVIAGERDAAGGGAVAGTGPGDDGGATPAPSLAGTIDDTRIHVQLVCRTAIADVTPNVNDQQQRGNDGLPWGNAAGDAHEVPCGAMTPSPADAFADERWTSGDRTPAGWTP